jgi:hypothetical protein
MSDFNGAFDGACAEALKLDTMNLRRFDFFILILDQLWNCSTCSKPGEDHAPLKRAS